MALHFLLLILMRLITTFFFSPLIECIANLCACCIKDGDTLGGGRKYQPDQLEQSEPRIAAVPYASGDRASDDPRYRHNDRRWVPPLSNIEMQQRPTKGEAKKANYQQLR